MSNYRRNLLVNSYIADGLAFQLCGEDATLTNWIDRIGKKEFVLSNCTLGNKCVCFNGSNSFGKSDVFGWKADSSTIEIVFKLNNGNSYQLLFISPTNNSIAFGLIAGRSCLWSNTSYPYPEITYNDKIKTVSINKNLSYYNLSLVSKVSGDFWYNNSSHTYIGCRKEPNQDFFNGNIYQIRIYNRILSADEIIYNQNIDINKYGIKI